VRFEEEVVERWYILKGYLTTRNILYQSPVKRPGGKGRSEIDLLAVKLEDNSIKERVHCEISVSITSPFPFISKKRLGVDEVRRLVKRFFSKGAELKVIEYLGTDNYKRVLVTSRFADNIKELLEGNLPRFNATLVSMNETTLGYEVEIEHSPSDPEVEVKGKRKIELVEFPTILKELKDDFKEMGLMKKDFADPIMRALQWLTWEEAKKKITDKP
jgi:hypothetical protein